MSMATQRATALRILSAEMVEKAGSGHPGLPLGFADVMAVLWGEFLTFDINSAGRDRFVLSAGHGSALLYSTLHMMQALTLEDLQQFRQWGSCTPGHPEYGLTPGVEATTGPLGQGLGMAVGMALGHTMMAEDFGQDIGHHYTYAVVGDGCLMEGISQEAITLATHWNLGRLIVLFDDNGITIDGAVSQASQECQIQRFSAAGWHVQAIDGHNHQDIRQAIAQAQKNSKPSMIACKTHIGWGSLAQGTAKAHGTPLGSTGLHALYDRLGIPHRSCLDPLPNTYYTAWQDAIHRSREKTASWQKVFQNLPVQKQQEFQRRMKRALPAHWSDLCHTMYKTAQEPKALATRQWSQVMLESLTLPEMVGGSADLTGSNNTQASHQQAWCRQTSSPGRYLHYGIREHAMAAVMNGLSIYGGWRPYGGTFLVFSDYARPAIRLSALMKAPVIYVLTHDSIALGEDGPTHQPVEHLDALRCIPHINVMRPAYGLEVAVCWALALEETQKPTILALTRQKVPAISYDNVENIRKGAYILREGKDPIAQIWATGSEVSVALALYKAYNERIRIISAPCPEIFFQQSLAYQTSLIQTMYPQFVIEASVGWMWSKYLPHACVIGVNDFGASAPGPRVMTEYGMCPKKIKHFLDRYHLQDYAI